MASPVADTYSAPSGVPVYGGRYAAGGVLSGSVVLTGITAGGGMSESSGVLTGAALLAGITASGEMSEPPTPASSITVTDLDNLRVFQRVGSSRDITVAGTYGGSPSGIQARAVPDGTSLSSTGYAWTTIDAAPSGGTFSAALSVPTGGWYNIQVRDTAASVSDGGTNKWAVGIVVALLGQSNVADTFTNSSAFPSGDARAVAYKPGAWNRIGYIADGYAAGTPFSTYSAGTWTAGVSAIDGDTLTYFANRLVASLGSPIAVLPYAVGGSTIDTWLPGTGANWTTFSAAAAAAGSDFEATIWLQGESDAGTSMSTYKTRLAAVHAGLLALNGRSATDHSLGVVPIASCYDTWKAAGTFGLVRTAHLEYVAGASGAYIVNSALDADLGGNQVHYTFASHKRQAMRWAEWLIRAATGTLTTMQGPVITSATRAGATVTVNVTQHGGTSLVDGAGGSGSALAGFRVYDGASLMTISSTSISGNTITLNLSATPSGAVTMDFAMKNFAFDADPPVAASIVCDNQSIPGETRGIPLQPCPTITVT